MDSAVAASAITAAASLLGVGLGSYTTYRLARPFRQEAALNRIAALFEKRFPVYIKQWRLTEYGSEAKPRDLPLSEREKLAGEMRDWYYNDAAGLLISGRVFNAWRTARRLLRQPDATPAEIWSSLSALRSALKVELGARQIEELPVPFAEPEDENW